MKSSLNLAIFVLVVAYLYGPVCHWLTVLGVFRAAADVVTAEAQKIHKIEDTMQCEDMHYHQPSGYIFTACEDSFLPRFKWFPPLGNLEGPAPSTGSFHLIDPKTLKSKRLAFENFSGPFVTHGIDLVDDPNRSGAVYIYAINHLSNPDYYEGPSAEGTPRAHSQIELFHHVLESNTVRHVRSIAHPLIVTPNDIYAESPSSIHVTNDHFYREGIMRTVEDIMPLAKWTNIIHVNVDITHSGSAATGIDAVVACQGYRNFNGLGHGQSSDELLLSSAAGGILYRARANHGNRTLSVLDEFAFESTIDNPSYYHDPYATAEDNASGYVVGGLLRAVDLPQSRRDPTAQEGVMVWHLRRHVGETAEPEWEKRLIFEDDGTNIRTASTALLLPVEPKAHADKTGMLFVTGFVSKNIIAVEVSL
ncbi:serum paraoxonase/arylesterase family protein [Aspergillus homomorphus CBS 101889]|uniref:Serum paraoxonase/arylesterase family protein n=1 Tax=Aspergillus homomorphus (strain CBS 101889) TaxID=1450537 RepID=A0A395HI87_ASPHC|nr:serum paraoxonase/arylesterase family protein [Aspergillus homomorphus CBS 101889]RAL06885.1 serum paraoxonase/arylesterase family protein [Aspergillus homomorphus CBS 101889]